MQPLELSNHVVLVVHDVPQLVLGSLREWLRQFRDELFISPRERVVTLSGSDAARRDLLLTLATARLRTAPMSVCAPLRSRPLALRHR